MVGPHVGDHVVLLPPFYGRGEQDTETKKGMSLAWVTPSPRAELGSEASHPSPLLRNIAFGSHHQGLGVWLTGGGLVLSVPKTLVPS